MKVLMCFKGDREQVDEFKRIMTWDVREDADLVRYRPILQ